MDPIAYFNVMNKSHSFSDCLYGKYFKAYDRF